MVSVYLRCADAAGLHDYESGSGLDAQESLLVEAVCYAHAGLRAVHFDIAAANPGGSLPNARGNLCGFAGIKQRVAGLPAPDNCSSSLEGNPLTPMPTPMPG